MDDSDTKSLFEGAQKIESDDSDIIEIIEESEYHGDDQKEIREGYPSAMLYLFEFEGSRLILDWAMEQAYEGEIREYSKAAIARETGVARKTVYEHLEKVLNAGVLEEVANGQTRYRVNTDSDVMRALIALNESLTEELTDT